MRLLACVVACCQAILDENKINRIDEDLTGKKPDRSAFNKMRGQAKTKYN
jgi:hypothetical protein